MEIWKDIKGYEGLYQVSNLGRVKSLDRYEVFNNGLRFRMGRFIKPRKEINGYLRLNLYNHSKKKMYSIHRLVMNTFSPNSNDKLQVNHKDENKNNNILDNLEWCTAKENCNYGNRNIKINNKLNRELIGKKNMKAVYAINNINEIVNKFNSIKQASEEFKIPNSNIVSCCKGKRNTAAGYKWIYANEYNKKVG